MKTIQQARVSPSIQYFQTAFHKRYYLKPYTNAFAPTLFFGCYTNSDLFAVSWHQGFCALAWAGSDAINLKKIMANPSGRSVMTRPNVHHIAIGKHIAQDLDAAGLQYTILPLCCVNKNLFQPTPATGKGIYVYLPKYDREKYGGSFIDALQARMPNYEWFINDGLRYQPEDMPKIYKRCMTGIRATRHDGLSNTVVEMGLMGRRVLWNGWAPNAIPFETLDDAEVAIRREIEWPSDRLSVGEDVANWIDIGEAWKSVEFYSNPTMKVMSKELLEQPYSYHRYFDFRYNQGILGAGGPQPAGAEAQFTREYVLKTLRDTESESVVEIGCGSMVRWGNPCSENYIGIDVSEKAIQQARERFPNHSFIRRDVTVEDIPTADAIVCIDMFQHIKHEDVLPLLKKMLAAATKTVIVKTSVNIPENYYQFNHDWESFKIEVGEPSLETTVPGVPHAKFFVFTKVLPFSAGEDRGRGLAAASVPGASLTEQEPAAC